MLVHLYGKCAYTEKIGEICKRHGLKLIEDNAQATGCKYNGRRTGSLGMRQGKLIPVKPAPLVTEVPLPPTTVNLKRVFGH